MKRIDANGIEMAVVDQGSGAPLLLAHGFPLDHSMWAGQIEGLASDCRVIAPDLRGFGQSQVTPGTVGMDLMADDLAALLDALGIDGPVVFCGLSMGGYVAWQFFKRHRRRVAGLVLCDTRAIPDTPEAAQGRRDTAARVLVDGPQPVVEGMVPKLFAATTAEAVIAAARGVMSGTDPRGIAAASLGMAERIDATSLLASIDCPTLAIVGQQDAISTVEEMALIVAQISGARLVEIANAGHISPLEQPQAVNEAIREFVAAMG